MDNKTNEDLRVRRTHKLLYNALLDLMEKHPFENITVKQICDSAMVHRTTFYTHFNDKYDLLTRALRQIAEEELNFVNKTSISPSESFKEVFTAAIKHKRLFSQLLTEERDSLRNLLRREMKAGMMKYLEDNHISIEYNSIDLQINLEAYIGCVLGVLNWWLDNNMPIDQKDIYKKLEILTDWNFLNNK